METARQIDTLPVLPLTTGVVLPQMVVTLALETDEARAAAEAALAGDRRVLLVPRTGRGYARVGTVAHIEDAGDLPSGIRALVDPGCPAGGDRRRRSRRAGRRFGCRPSWSTRVPPCRTARVSWRASTAPSSRTSSSTAARGQVAESLRGITDPAAMADTAGYSPDLSLRAQDRGARDARRRTAPREGAGLGAGDAGRPVAQGAHPQRRGRRHGEDAAGVPAAPAAGGHPQGARRRRR